MTDILCNKYDPRNTAVLDPTRVCTSQCRACCNPSAYRPLEEIDKDGLKEGEYMDIGFAKTVISQVAKRCKHISIQGGEPTIDMDRLVQIVNYAKREGMSVEVVTNASRFIDYEKARGIASRLKEAGVGFLQISAGYEHNWSEDEGIQLNKHPIPSRNVTYAVFASNEAGMFTELRLLGRGRQLEYVNQMSRYIMKSIGGGVLLPVVHPALLDYSKNGHTIRFVSVQTFPVAKGANIDRKDIFRYEFPVGHCGLNDAMRDDINSSNTVRIGHKGEVRPCCGPGGRIMLEGDLREERLEKIVARANKDNKLVRLLTNVDINDIISLAFEEGLAKPGVYFEYCDFCYHELANPEKTDVYLDMLKKRFDIKV